MEFSQTDENMETFRESNSVSEAEICVSSRKRSEPEGENEMVKEKRKKED